MKLAAAEGIASAVADEELDEDYIVPSVFNRDVSQAVAAGRSRRGGARVRARRRLRRQAQHEGHRHRRHRERGPRAGGGARTRGARGDRALARRRQRAPQARRRRRRCSSGPTPKEAPPPPEALEGQDAVVHLLGEPIDQRWATRPSTSCATRACCPPASSWRALKAADARPAVLVSQSASGCYGPRATSEWTSPRPPATTSSPTGASSGRPRPTRPRTWACAW